MDLPVWFVLATVLLVVVRAGPTDQGPQKFSDPPPAETPKQEKKQHKREPKYEEVILYLTPSQIRAYESGKGLMTPQQAAELKASEEGQALRPPQQANQYTTLEMGQGLGQSQKTDQFGGLEGGQESVPPLQSHQPQQEAKYPAIELTQGLVPPRQTAQAPQIFEFNLSAMNEQFKEEMKNAQNDAGQKLQKEVKKLEIKQKEQMQLQESNKNKEGKDKESYHILPENSVLHLPRFDLQKREKYFELPLPLQFIPQHWSLSRHQYGTPSAVPHFEQQLIAPPATQIEPHLTPIAHPQLKHLPLQHVKTGLGPQNYAFLYFYPHNKPTNNENLQLFFPPSQELKPKELFFHQEHQSVFNLHPKFQLVPYEYDYQNKLEAQKILQEQLENHELDAHHLEAHKLEAHQLEEFDSQQLLLQKNLEPHYQQQHEKPQLQEHKYEPKEINLKILPNTAALLAQPSKEIKIDLSELGPNRQQEMKELFEAQKLKAKTEAEEKEAQRLDAQLKEEELKAEQFKAEQLKEELLKSQKFSDELFKSQEFRDQLFKNELFKNQEFKEQLFKDQEFKKELFKNQDFKEELFKLQEYKEEPFQNNQFKEESLQSQQPKEELYKNEYPDLEYLQKLEPKKTQMYSILSPLFQGHSITESLQQEKKSFPHHKIHLETGFKPLQYAPKFNDQKYAREVEKILQRNLVEKQRALAKAAAIANEPPEIIHSEEKIEASVMSPMPMIKHIEVPVHTPVMVPVPTPIEVKVPQPYPVPMEIIRPFPVSIVKTEKVEVRKPVPIEIEKRVPVPVTKNVYVKVDKPYYVQKMIPVEVKREVPVEVPVKLKTPLKLSIIKHVWEH